MCEIDHTAIEIDNFHRLLFLRYINFGVAHLFNQDEYFLLMRIKNVIGVICFIE